MLENLALSISTALFFLCNLFVYSLIPSLPSDTDAPAAPLVEADIAVMAEADAFTLVGQWNSGGRILEFTRSGKLIFDGQAMPYEISGDVVTVQAKVGGEERVYTLSLEMQSERVMILNGVPMYRVEP